MIRPTPRHIKLISFNKDIWIRDNKQNLPQKLTQVALKLK